MSRRRVDRLNSLLKEVISDVIRKDVKNPHVDLLLTVARVEISQDLRHAKVYVSIIGPSEKKKKTIEALQSAAGFIAVQASKEMVIRFFPDLLFVLDDSVDKQMKIEELLQEIAKKNQNSSSS